MSGSYQGPGILIFYLKASLISKRSSFSSPFTRNCGFTTLTNKPFHSIYVFCFISSERENWPGSVTWEERVGRGRRVPRDVCSFLASLTSELQSFSFSNGSLPASEWSPFMRKPRYKLFNSASRLEGKEG